MSSPTAAPPPAGTPQLQVHAERCVHQRSVHAQCTRCIDACASAALSDSADGLLFDAARCVACGLCVSACPTAVFTLSAMRSCPKSGSALAQRRLPCVHALGEAQWLHWQRSGLRRLPLADPTCTHCDHVPADWQHTMGQRLGQINAALQSRQQARLALADAHATELRTPALCADASRKHATQTLSALGAGQPLWGVQLDSSRCNACLTCAHLCPSQAIEQVAQGAQTHLQLDMSRCVGCGLCVQACDQRALANAPAATLAARPLRLPLVRHTCAGCGAPVLALQGARRAHELRCPSCRSSGPHRPNRWVQPANASHGAKGSA